MERTVLELSGACTARNFMRCSVSYLIADMLSWRRVPQRHAWRTSQAALTLTTWATRCRPQRNGKKSPDAADAAGGLNTVATALLHSAKSRASQMAMDAALTRSLQVQYINNSLKVHADMVKDLKAIATANRIKLSTELLDKAALAMDDVADGPDKEVTRYLIAKQRLDLLKLNQLFVEPKPYTMSRRRTALHLLYLTFVCPP